MDPRMVHHNFHNNENVVSDTAESFWLRKPLEPFCLGHNSKLEMTGIRNLKTASESS